MTVLLVCIRRAMPVFRGMMPLITEKLLKEMEMPFLIADRKAAFICVMALAGPDGSCQTFDGKISGLLA